jgi:lysophospholipase L1-like esterase
LKSCEPSGLPSFLLAVFFLASPAASAEEDAVRPPVIYLIGDSTMADKNADGGNPERGWGQLLPEFCVDGARVENHAKDGCSTKSFLDEGLWTPVAGRLQPGDWLVIQFGHNDQKQDKPHLYTDAATTYRQNLGRFVEEARAKGASPVLATSIYRRYYGDHGKPKSTLGAYPEAARQTAAGLDVPLVDLNEQTRVLLESWGPEKSKALYLHFAPGEIPFYPNGKGDNTHLSEKGARAVAECFVRDVQAQGLALGRWLRIPASRP